MDKIQIKPSERAILYEMFASLFLQTPTKEKIEGLPSIFEEISEILPMIDLKSFEASIKELRDFKQEYYDHFFVPSTKNYIPPYESAVIDATIKSGDKKKKWKYGSLWTNSTYHVSMCYEAVGFNPFELQIEEGLKASKVPDHIGFELAFMGYLSLQEASYEEIPLEDRTKEDIENINKWDKLQEQFLKEHLQKFVSLYYEIAKEKFNPFYLQLLNILNSYIELDLKTK